MSEQEIPKEQLRQAPFIYGISVSNLENDINPRMTLHSLTTDIGTLLATENMGIEFQLESPDRMSRDCCGQFM